MPDKKLAPTSIELLNECMNQLAREIGAMDPDDPRRNELIDERSALSLVLREDETEGLSRTHRPYRVLWSRPCHQE